MKSLKAQGLALILLSGDVLAVGDANESTVRYIEVFSSASSRDGEVVVKLDAETESCNQYWIKSEESVGQKNSVASILASLHAKSTVRIVGDTDSLWSGSSAFKTCEIISLRVL
ncbi:hypothetical protein ACJJH9_05630 [Microbulbifer sp. DLAB2-AF]|uniref:hypothetical protein n=1 Tax=Microbulbifer sp. DLAB2-AF TaxID=3243395 RepID=UPI0040396BB5